MKNTKSVIVGFGMLVAYAVVALPSFVSSAESGKGPHRRISATASTSVLLGVSDFV